MLPLPVPADTLAAECVTRGPRVQGSLGGRPLLPYHPISGVTQSLVSLAGGSQLYLPSGIPATGLW